MLAPRRDQNVSLFETRTASNLSPIPRVTDDPDAGMYGHCNHRLAKYVLAKERAQGAGDQPEQGKTLKTRQQADQQKEQDPRVPASLHAINLVRDAIARTFGQFPDSIALKALCRLIEHGLGNKRYAENYLPGLCRIFYSQIEHDRAAGQGSKQNAGQDACRSSKRKQGHQREQDVRNNKKQGSFRKTPRKAGPQDPAPNYELGRLRFIDKLPSHRAPVRVRK